MPILITPVAEKDCWSGSTWTIEDEDELAELIARVAIGQSRIVKQILMTTGDLSTSYPKGSLEGARNLLTVETGDETYHRDGWVFSGLLLGSLHIVSIKTPLSVHLK